MKIKFDSRLNASVLLVATLMVGCTSVPKADSQPNYPKETAAIERRVHEIFSAAESKDFDRLDSYHFYGPKFTKFTGSSAQRLDADAGRVGEHKGLGAIAGLKMQADALKIDVFGNAGIATFILNYSFESGGATIQKKERTTLVFVRDGGEWKIIHEHLSPITQ
jgi:ketosteroid isomerase-like protein